MSDPLMLDENEQRTYFTEREYFGEAGHDEVPDTPKDMSRVKCWNCFGLVVNHTPERWAECQKELP